MSRPLISAMTLALLGALPALADAASTQRFSASARLLPSAVVSGGRFNLEARLLESGAPLSSDAKQPEPLRPKAGPATRFRLFASVHDVNAPAGDVCALGTLFENGFE